MWGIFLAYIRRRLSSLLRFHVFWEVGRDIQYGDFKSWFGFIASSGYFGLSVYMWGIFLAYIRRQLSSRLHFHVFWKTRDTLYWINLHSTIIYNASLRAHDTLTWTFNRTIVNYKCESLLVPTLFAFPFLVPTSNFLPFFPPYKLLIQPKIPNATLLQLYYEHLASCMIACCPQDKFVFLRKGPKSFPFPLHFHLHPHHVLQPSINIKVIDDNLN